MGVYRCVCACVCAIVLEYLFQRYVHSFTHLTHINRDNEKRGTEDECVVVCVCVTIGRAVGTIAFDDAVGRGGEGKIP